VLPAGIIFLISLLGKKGLVITLAFIPVLISAFYYLSFFVPISSPDLLGNEQRFRIATLNIWNHNSDIKQVIGVIDNTQADVVALQEITEEQREDLVAGLRQQYPHYHISKAVYGGTTAVFSRHPLRNVREIDIQIDRPSIVADLNWDEDPITVISAHLNPSFWAYWRQPWYKIPGNYLQYIKDQNAQVEAILDELNRRVVANAIFLACDCNSQETASTNKLLNKTFKDAFRTVGWQVGETGSPDLRFERNLTHIDYIWFSGNAEPIAVFRGTLPSQSDHDPVIVDFVIGN